jgi:hypothetical protein
MRTTWLQVPALLPMRPGEGLVFQSTRRKEDVDGMHFGWQNVLSKRLQPCRDLSIVVHPDAPCFGTPGSLVDENGG